MDTMEYPPKMVLQIHDKIVQKLDYFNTTNTVPHIIFHGASGAGKRTIVNDFLMKIYQNDKTKIKTNVLSVNCAHGKGIKYIREDLKFFAKTNIQSNNGILFKTIVLVNADYLTIDAQSALRRSIELYSYNTRFFIIVENKDKLLNPILSRFCEIYVPTMMNLHKYSIEQIYKIDNSAFDAFVDAKMRYLFSNKTLITHIVLVNTIIELYENGNSCIDVIKWIGSTFSDDMDPLLKSAVCLCFDKVKAEYRSEKLLMLYILDFLFLRNNKDLKCVSLI